MPALERPSDRRPAAVPSFAITHATKAAVPPTAPRSGADPEAEEDLGPVLVEIDLDELLAEERADDLKVEREREGSSIASWSGWDAIESRLADVIRSGRPLTDQDEADLYLLDLDRRVHLTPGQTRVAATVKGGRQALVWEDIVRVSPRGPVI
jgi:hypothetical protein